MKLEIVVCDYKDSYWEVLLLEVVEDVIEFDIIGVLIEGVVIFI